MEAGANGAVWRKPLISIATFVLHQFIGTFGVPIFAYLLGISLHDLASQLGAKYSMRPVYFILTETPYFPVQIALGLWCGWSLARRFRFTTMVYVWIIPFFILTLAVLTPLRFSPGITSVLAHEPSRFSHYFGWGCQPKDHCLDQIVITMPSYAASAYSLGAWIAFKAKRASPNNKALRPEGNY